METFSDGRVNHLLAYKTISDIYIYLNFTFFYTQSQHTTGSGSLMCWGVKNDFLITIIREVTKLVGW